MVVKTWKAMFGGIKCEIYDPLFSQTVSNHSIGIWVILKELSIYTIHKFHENSHYYL
jgi:hypothetical protein